MPALAAQRSMLASTARSIPKSLLRQLFRRNITGSGRPGAAILILRLVRPPGITPSGVGGAVSASGHWRQSAKAAAASNALGTGYPGAVIAPPADKTKHRDKQIRHQQGGRSEE